MPIKTKNRTTIKTTRLSTSAERFHWKAKAPTKKSTSRTPRTGKIYRMLSRDAGVEGLGALLTYSISDSSGSIKILSTLSCINRYPSIHAFVFNQKQYEQSQRYAWKTPVNYLWPIL